MKKTPSQTGTIPHLDSGDIVVINATARRYRRGSSPLPPALPVKLRQAESALLVEIEAIAPQLFRQLSEPVEVLKVSTDGERVQVKTSDGRKHAFAVEDLQLFQSREDKAHANG